MKTQGFKLKELLAIGLHTYNPGTLEAEEEDINKCESGLRSETLSQIHALPKKPKEICGAAGLVGWVKYLLRKREDISRDTQNSRCSGLLAMLRIYGTLDSAARVCNPRAVGTQKAETGESQEGVGQLSPYTQR